MCAVEMYAQLKAEKTFDANKVVISTCSLQLLLTRSLLHSLFLPHTNKPTDNKLLATLHFVYTSQYLDILLCILRRQDSLYLTYTHTLSSLPTLHIVHTSQHLDIILCILRR